MKKTLLVAVAATLILSSCKKESDGKASAPLTYKMSSAGYSAQVSRITSASADGTTLRLQGGTLTWISGFINTTDIKFEVKGEEKVEYKAKAEQRLDLFSDLSTIGAVPIPAGSYEKVEFKTSLAPTATEPALELQGNFLSGGVTTPVTLQVASSLEFKFEKKTPTVIDATTNYSVLNHLALDVLSAGITEQMLNSATQTGGVILISASSNPELYNTIWNALQGILKVEIKKD